MDIPIIYCKIYLQTYRHDMTYSVLKVPLNPNQPTLWLLLVSRLVNQHVLLPNVVEKFIDYGHVRTSSAMTLLELLVGV